MKAINNYFCTDCCPSSGFNVHVDQKFALLSKCDSCYNFICIKLFDDDAQEKKYFDKSHAEFQRIRELNAAKEDQNRKLQHKIDNQNLFYHLERIFNFIADHIKSNKVDFLLKNHVFYREHYMRIMSQRYDEYCKKAWNDNIGVEEKKPVLTFEQYLEAH